MIERDVFSREISQLDYSVGELFEKVTPYLKDLATGKLLTFDCSKIIDDKSSVNLYRPTFWTSIYKKLDGEKQNFIDKRTDLVLRTKTGIDRKLNRKKKEDLPFINQYFRIRDCEVKNFLLYSLHSYFYQLTDQEIEDVHMCASMQRESMRALNDMTKQSFDLFRSYLQADIKTETSFFLKAIKYIVLMGCFYFINALAPLVVPKISSFLGRLPAQPLSLPAKSSLATENLFQDTTKDISQKIIEDQFDKTNENVKEFTVKNKTSSITEFLIRSNIDNVLFASASQDDAYKKTYENMVAAIKFHGTDEGIKKAIIRDFKAKARIHSQNVNDKQNLKTLYFRTTSELFANFINQFYRVRMLANWKPGYNFDNSIPDFPGGRRYYDGFMAIFMSVHDDSYLRFLNPQENALKFSKKAGFKIMCPFHENVTAGFQQIVRTTIENRLSGGTWDNPIDMPINKLLSLAIYNKGTTWRYEILIEMKATDAEFYDTTRFFRKYDYSSKSRPKFQDYFQPVGLGSIESEVIGNIVKSMFKDPKIPSGKYSLNRLPMKLDSIDLVKEITRTALLSKDIKLK